MQSHYVLDLLAHILDLEAHKQPSRSEARLVSDRMRTPRQRCTALERTCKSAHRRLRTEILVAVSEAETAFIEAHICSREFSARFQCCAAVQR